MSRLTGGIFSKPSGQTAGVVFGQARTRQGKVVTARQLVIPSNPNTAPQQTQRSKFSSTKDIVRSSTSAFYQNPFNRSVAQLPGFQSLMSIFLNAMEQDFELSAPPQTNLGSLDAPQSLSAVALNGVTSIQINFSSLTPLKGSAGDTIHAIVIPKSQLGRDNYQPAFVSTAVVTRSALTLSILTGALVTGDVWLVGVFAKGVAPYLGIYSPCTWFHVTVV